MLHHLTSKPSSSYHQYLTPPPHTHTPRTRHHQPTPGKVISSATVAPSQQVHTKSHCVTVCKAVDLIPTCILSARPHTLPVASECRPSTPPVHEVHEAIVVVVMMGTLGGIHWQLQIVGTKPARAGAGAGAGTGAAELLLTHLRSTMQQPLHDMTVTVSTPLLRDHDPARLNFTQHVTTMHLYAGLGADGVQPPSTSKSSCQAPPPPLV